MVSVDSAVGGRKIRDNSSEANPTVRDHPTTTHDPRQTLAGYVTPACPTHLRCPDSELLLCRLCVGCDASPVCDCRLP